MKHNFIIKISQFDWARQIIKLHVLNNTAKLAPYHNTNHGFVVTENVWKAALWYGIEPHNLICAALWHDFNHSQGILKDSLNVKIAIQNFAEWFTADKFPEINPINVVSIIQATEYQDGKYTIPAERLSLEQKIIRDADLCQYAEKNRFGQVYLGLSQEMNIPVLQLIQNAPKFINSVKPNTEWFEHQWPGIKAEILQEFLIIEKILTE